MQTITMAKHVASRSRSHLAVLSPLCTKVFGLMLCALALASSPGCTMLDSTWDEMASWNDKVPWKDSEDDDDSKIPSRVTAVWTDSVMSRPGLTSQRGFGGRLMFYESQKEDPVKVDGQLVIYMFDETNRDPKNCVPERRIIITADQFKNHYSKSSVGHSYSVWAPWGDVGGHRKQISLVVRFEPTNGGGSLMSELTKQILPGTEPPAIVEAESAPAEEVMPGGQIQQAAYVSGQSGPAGSPNSVAQAAQFEEPQPSMQTTTITIPPSSVSVPQLIDGKASLQALADQNGMAALLGAPSSEAAPPPLGQPGNNSTAAEAPPAESTEVIDQRQAWEAYRQGGWEAYRKLRQTDALRPTIRPQSSVHSAPRTHQLPAASIAQPRDARAPMRPHPAGWPSGPASSPPAEAPSDSGGVTQAPPQHFR